MKKRNDDIEQICAYCENAVVICESEICICKLEGAVRQQDSCKKFSLDLLKLAPLPKKLPDEDTVFFEI
ncbi:MAG: hypothetical protein E7595_07660 [Ruminococcaceae bacterium]|nr:hypothetical protein [Oscillospiraceae bacterium]